MGGLGEDNNPDLPLHHRSIEVEKQAGSSQMMVLLAPRSGLCSHRFDIRHYQHAPPQTNNQNQEVCSAILTVDAMASGLDQMHV